MFVAARVAEDEVDPKSDAVFHVVQDKGSSAAKPARCSGSSGAALRRQHPAKPSSENAGKFSQTQASII